MGRHNSTDVGSSNGLKEWDSRFDRRFNRSVPGLAQCLLVHPSVRALSGHVYDFMCKSSLSDREYWKGRAIFDRVKKCVDFLKQSLIRVIDIMRRGFLPPSTARMAHQANAR